MTSTRRRRRVNDLAAEDMGALFRAMGGALTRHADIFDTLQAKVDKLEKEIHDQAAQIEDLQAAVHPEEVAKTAMNGLFDELASAMGSVCCTSLPSCTQLWSHKCFTCCLFAGAENQRAAGGGQEHQRSCEGVEVCLGKAHC